MLAGPQYDAALSRAADREYPRSLRSIDTALYTRLGLMPRSLQAQLASNGHASRAWYDPLARRLLLRRDADGPAGVGRQRARPRARRPELQPPADRDTARARPRPRDRCEEHRGRDRCARVGRECEPRAWHSARAVRGTRVGSRRGQSTREESCATSAARAHLQVHCACSRRRRNSFCTSTSSSSASVHSRSGSPLGSGSGG